MSECTINIRKGTNAWALYDKLRAGGVVCADLDADGDGKVNGDEVEKYAREIDYERYRIYLEAMEYSRGLNLTEVNEKGDSKKESVKDPMSEETGGIIFMIAGSIVMGGGALNFAIHREEALLPSGACIGFGALLFGIGYWINSQY